MADNRRQARRSLDARFDKLRPLVKEPRPHRGWIRAIRQAIGMSTGELASRMGVIQQTIPYLENSELHDTIKLATLRRAAEALDCELVYFLVPRKRLNDTVMEQARRQAARHLLPVAHHSRLEDQALTADDAEDQLNEFAARFIDRRGLWSEPGSLR